MIAHCCDQLADSQSFACNVVSNGILWNISQLRGFFVFFLVSDLAVVSGLPIRYLGHYVLFVDSGSLTSADWLVFVSGIFPCLSFVPRACFCVQVVSCEP